MPKSNAEKCLEYRQKKKENKVKKVAKSSTERVREFRLRRKALLNEQHNIYIAQNNTFTIQNSENHHCGSRVDVLNVKVDVSVGNNIENNYFFEMPKSNAEICREYRKRKKAKNKIKKVSEIPLKKINNAKNCQMYRLRKKMLAQANQSSTNQVLYTPSTPNSPMTFGTSPLLVTTGINYN